MEKHWHEVLRYVAAAIANTLTNAGIFNLLMFATGITRGYAIIFFSIISYAIGITQAFLINKHWVFKHRQPATARVYGSFLIVTLLMSGVGIGLLYVATSVIGAPPGISGTLWANLAIIAILPITFIGNFLGNKLLVFRPQARTED
jgi:putative flippase GtrA